MYYSNSYFKKNSNLKKFTNLHILLLLKLDSVPVLKSKNKMIVNKVLMENEIR